MANKKERAKDLQLRSPSQQAVKRLDAKERKIWLVRETEGCVEFFTSAGYSIQEIAAAHGTALFVAGYGEGRKEPKAVTK